MCFGLDSKSTLLGRIFRNKLSDLTHLSTFQGTLAEKLESLPLNNNKRLLLHKNAMHSVGSVSYGLTRRVVIYWISVKSLGLLDARQFVPDYSKTIESRLVTRHEMNTIFRRD